MTSSSLFFTAPVPVKFTLGSDGKAGSWRRIWVQFAQIRPDQIWISACAVNSVDP